MSSDEWLTNYFDRFWEATLDNFAILAVADSCPTASTKSVSTNTTLAVPTNYARSWPITVNHEV
jgi:hypothetical protein